MVKQYCDICERETKRDELIGEFKALELNVGGKMLGAESSNNPMVVHYVLCLPCKQVLKRKVVEMIDEERQSKKNG